MLMNKIFNASALVSIFLNVVTRLNRRAEPSQQTCRLQSARLLSLVASPFKRTTIHLIIVRLYTS